MALRFIAFALVILGLSFDHVLSDNCLGGFDLYFVLDKSSSVGPKHFKEETVSFVQKIVSSFVSSKLRVSFITFSTQAELVMELTDDRIKIDKGLELLRKVATSGNTHMNLGLEKANRQIKEFGEKTASVIITLTDGQIVNKAKETFAQAKVSRLYGASVYAVGVDRYNINELYKIADKPSRDHVFVASSYNALQNIIDSIIKKSCIEILSAQPQITCADEPFVATLSGNGFTKTNNISRVRCNFKHDTKDYIAKAFFVNDTMIKCQAPKLPHPTKVNLRVSMNSVKFVSSDVYIETEDCRPRISSVQNTKICTGETKVVSVSGSFLMRRTEGNSTRNVACRIAYNSSYSVRIAVVSSTSSEVKCEIPEHNSIGETVMLQITSADYENVLKTSTFKVISCVPIKKRVNVGLILGILFALFLLGLLLLWWFWLLLFPKPKTESVSPTSSTGPPKKKWPSVDTSYYGGGGIGGITPVKVKWGDKGVTDAGALLAADEKAKKSKTTSSSSSEDNEPKPSCLNVTKQRVISFFALFPRAYTWLASRRPQRTPQTSSSAEYRHV